MEAASSSQFKVVVKGFKKMGQQKKSKQTFTKFSSGFKTYDLHRTPHIYE